MKLGDVASLLGGELTGEPDTEISGVAGLAEAREGDISFISDAKSVPVATESAASCFLVKKPVPEIDKPQLMVANPQFAFAVLLGHFYKQPRPEPGVHEKAFVADSAQIADGVSVGACAVVSDGAKVGARSVVYPGAFIGEGSTIGEDCLIYPNVVIREGVTLGDRVIVQAGAVIGSDGFGYVFHEGKHSKIPQVGGVVIGDDVEIGSCAAIDRATTGNTVIGNGTKIDNLVQVAHNVTVGENTILVSQVGIAGSCKIGSGVVMGGQVGLADHLTIDDGVILGARAGVMNDLKRGVYVGEPATPRRDYLRVMSYFFKLPELNDKIKELEAKLESLERSRGDGDN